MKHLPVILASIAVILATVQAFWTASTRDDHIEAIVDGRVLDACAEIGAAATDFGFRAQAAQASFSPNTFAAVSDGPRALSRAAYMAAYLLPEEASQDAAHMRNISQRIVAELSQRNESQVAELLREFDAINRRVQESCRIIVQASRFAP